MTELELIRTLRKVVNQPMAGGRVRVKPGNQNPELSGKTGVVDRVYQIAVVIDGKKRYLSPNSLELAD